VDDLSNQTAALHTALGATPGAKTTTAE